MTDSLERPLRLYSWFGPAELVELVKVAPRILSIRYIA